MKVIYGYKTGIKSLGLSKYNRKRLIEAHRCPIMMALEELWQTLQEL